MSDLGCSYRITRNYDSLSRQEKKIADFVLQNTEQVISLNIEGLAKSADTSLSTVVRFVRHLGYDSFQHFRISLVRENVINENRVFEVPVPKGEDPVGIVFDAAVKTLDRTRQILNRQDLKKAVEIMLRSSRICLFGLGGSNIVAYNAYHKFMRLGLNLIYAQDFHMQLINASQLTEKDTALIFSHTGVNIDTLAIKEEVQKHKAQTICFCSAQGTPIAEDCSLVINVSPQETYVSESFSARVAYLTIIDVLYIMLADEMKEAGENNLEKMRDAMSRRSM